MSERVGVVWDDRLAEYDFGPGHPLAPIRVQLAMRLAAEFGLFAPAHVSILTPVEPVDDDAILRVHEPEYVRAVQAASADPHFYDAARGLGTDDDPVFPGMHQASCRIAGASLTAARAVHSGEVEHAVNLAGGLHHALPGAAEGFCVYNDIAVAIAWLLDQGVERVAYLDVDVHHGDGVQAIFWDDPRVLTISIHESPRTLFPGTGLPTETGGPDAPGTAVNIARAGRHERPGLAAGPARRRARRPGARSPRRSWSPSTASTRTSRTRWRTCSSRSTASGWPSRPCTGGRTGTPAAAGSPSAAAATSGSTSSRAPGRT